ncbi:MAG: cytochrome c oxidase subunit 3 family protein [Sulfurimonas sp.]|jgi:nitric oxide reductase NorE protein
MSKIVHLKESYPPGDFAIWIVIYIELLTFGLMFLGYAFSRRADIELFNASQSVLNQASGFVDTLILITSSYFVVKAVNTVKNARIENIQASNESASRWLLAAILFGIMFLANKLLEFSDIFSQGINLSTNTFFMFYLLLTMFHFMHVVLGIVILFNIRKRSKTGCYSEQNCRGIESGALYWHLVDLLWIILFPLVYILR